MITDHAYRPDRQGQWRNDRCDLCGEPRADHAPEPVTPPAQDELRSAIFGERDEIRRLVAERDALRATVARVEALAAELAAYPGGRPNLGTVVECLRNLAAGEAS